MGVSIGWRPHDPKALNYIDGGSSFWAIIKGTFGDKPILTREHVEFLQGVYACGHDGAQELINAIYEHEKIQVEAQW